MTERQHDPGDTILYIISISFTNILPGICSNTVPAYRGIFWIACTYRLKCLRFLIGISMAKEDEESPHHQVSRTRSYLPGACGASHERNGKEFFLSHITPITLIATIKNYVLPYGRIYWIVSEVAAAGRPDRRYDKAAGLRGLPMAHLHLFALKTSLLYTHFIP